MVARAQNRVTLDPRARDRLGLPVAHIACAHGEHDTALARAQLAAMNELAAAAGLAVRAPPSGRALDALAFRLARRRLLLASGAFVPGSAAHELGGAPIGDDPATSVCDPSGRLGGGAERARRRRRRLPGWLPAERHAHDHGHGAARAAEQLARVTARTGRVVVSRATTGLRLRRLAGAGRVSPALDRHGHVCRVARRSRCARRAPGATAGGQVEA